MSGSLHLDSVARALARAAAADAFAPVRQRLAELAVDDHTLRDVLTRVSHGPNDQREILQLRARVLGADDGDPAALFERYALIRVARGAASQVAALELPSGVRERLLEEFLWLAHPNDTELGWFAAGEYVFSALCKLVTFRRFPAGQLHWEVAGLPRSALGRVRWRDLPALLRGIRALRGFRPAFVPHLAWRRRQIVLSERAHHRSLRLMAAALERQPGILGFVAEAWFYAPDIGQVSPHLSWAPRLFQEWGGVVVTSGRAGTESGVLEGSRARRQAIEQGRFRPTLGLVVWPRSAMLRWAGEFDRTEQAGRPA